MARRARQKRKSSGKERFHSALKGFSLLSVNWNGKGRKWKTQFQCTQEHAQKAGQGKERMASCHGTGKGRNPTSAFSLSILSRIVL